MASNPCNVAPAFVTTPTLKTIVAVQTLDAQFDNYPFFLGLGLTCADVKPDFDANVAGAWIAGNFCAPGESFAAPTESSINGFTWPSISGPIIGPDDNYGFSIAVQVTQGGVVVPRGNYNVGYLLDAPACDGGSPTSGGYTQVITNNLTGVFPIVIGEDDITAVGIFVSDYQGVAPFTGFVDCGTGPIEYTDDITGLIKWPTDVSELNYMVDVITGIVNPDALWCCVTAGFGCCGAVGNPYAAGFLIPPPASPAPGEENITQPPLNSLLLLSNHTFQFPMNFGVKKK